MITTRIHLSFPLTLLLSFAACAQESVDPGTQERAEQGEGSPRSAATANVPAALLGTWFATGEDREQLEFDADGGLRVDGVSMLCKIFGERLELHAQGQRFTATWQIADDVLTISLRRADGSVGTERYRKVGSPGATATARERAGPATFVLPNDWKVARRDGDVAIVNPGFGAQDVVDALVVVAATPMQTDERRLAAVALLQRQLPRIAVDLQELAVEVELRRNNVRSSQASNGQAAELQVRGTAQGGRAVTIWIGTTKNEQHAVTVLAVMARGQEGQYVERARQILDSVTFHATAAVVEGQAAANDLVGLEFGNATFGSGSSLTTIYRFTAGGGVHRRTMFSSSVGGSDSSAAGSFTQRGDQVTIRVGDDAVDATIERRDGEIVGLRIGRTVYRRA